MDPDGVHICNLLLILFMVLMPQMIIDGRVYKSIPPLFGMNIGNMIAFTTITEPIFAWPGMGKLLVDSIYKADRPIIVAYLMITACMFVVINFLVDILYTLIDPRIELR